MVRIERKVPRFMLLASLVLVVSGAAMWLWPPHGDDFVTRMIAAMTPYLQLVSIVSGGIATIRFVLLALDKSPMLAADASGLSVEGGPPIPWDQVLSIEPFEFKAGIAVRGILVKLRDRKALSERQLGSIFTRLGQRNTPGDIFITDKLFAKPLLNAIAELHGERPR